MDYIQLGVSECRFADIIWEHEPVTSTELVKLANQELEWKRTTTHTVIRRLCDKGLFVNENGVVKSLIKKEQFYSLQSHKYVENSFGGSLPAFVAAFTTGHKITIDEAEALKKLIDQAKEE